MHLRGAGVQRSRASTLTSIELRARGEKNEKTPGGHPEPFHEHTEMLYAKYYKTRQVNESTGL
jgi:hypothetical protein